LISLILSFISFVDRDMVMRYHWGLAVGHIYGHEFKFARELEQGTPSPSQPEKDGATDLLPDLTDNEDIAELVLHPTVADLDRDIIPEELEGDDDDSDSLDHTEGSDFNSDHGGKVYLDDSDEDPEELLDMYEMYGNSYWDDGFYE
jgi:hypothetical protein